MRKHFLNHPPLRCCYLLPLPGVHSAVRVVHPPEEETRRRSSMPSPPDRLGGSSTPGSFPLGKVYRGDFGPKHGADTDDGSNDYQQGVLGQTSCWHDGPRRSRLGLKLPVAVVVVAVALISAGPVSVRAQEVDSQPADDPGDGSSVGESILSYLIIVVLVAASGLFSGLTLGLLGLDKIGLEIISNGDEPNMAAFAKVGSLLWQQLTADVSDLTAVVLCLPSTPDLYGVGLLARYEYRRTVRLAFLVRVVSTWRIVCGRID